MKVFSDIFQISRKDHDKFIISMSFSDQGSIVRSVAERDLVELKFMIERILNSPVEEVSDIKFNTIEKYVSLSETIITTKISRFAKIVKWFRRS